MPVYLIHFIFAIILFFIVNWIGKHAITLGYVQLSAFEPTDDAPALNFAFRFGSPIVFMVLVTAVLYALEMDWLVQDFYLVTVYYFAFRFGFNILWGRSLLLNWIREILTASFSVAGTYFLYIHLIVFKQRLIPDVSNIATELWVIVAVFLFAVLNKVEISAKGMEKRRTRYRKERFKQFKLRYGRIVRKITKDEDIELLIYAIMIYESFNRPALVRNIERLLFGIWKSKTLGVMQVQTEKSISDRESVKIGSELIRDAYKEFYHKAFRDHPTGDPEWLGLEARSQTIANYNRDDNYVNEVTLLYEALKEDIGRPK